MPPISQPPNLGLGAVMSQAGFLDLKKTSEYIMWSLYFNNDIM